MSLSLHKLEKFLSKHGFVIKKIFTLDNYCVYLELLSLTQADTCMLYIPSKYEIKIDRNDIDVYPLSYISIADDGNIPEDYAGEPDNFDLEKKYDEVDVDIIHHQKNMEDHLEESYNHPLSLKDINKTYMTNLREIFRQLRRLKFCVQSLKYKLCITYKGYLCCIRRNDTFECYHAQKYSSNSDDRKLFVTLDLETLYDKIDSVVIDIKTVREGIYKVLDKNQIKHTQNLYKILEYKVLLVNSSVECQRKVEKCTVHLAQLETLLHDLGKAEKTTVEKLMEIEARYNNPGGVKGLHHDIEKSHLISKHETQLNGINEVKKDIIANILKTKAHRENMSLKIDKICFDNIVMIDAIIKNFELLAEI